METRGRIPYPHSPVDYEDIYHYDTPFDEFDTATRGIRREASSLISRYNLPKPLYQIHRIPLSSSSDVRDVVNLRRNYVQSNIRSVSPIPDDYYKLSIYPEPVKRPYIGRGHLACMAYAGGRPVSKRRSRYFPEENKVSNEVNYRSYYRAVTSAANANKEYRRGQLLTALSGHHDDDARGDGGLSADAPRPPSSSDDT